MLMHREDYTVSPKIENSPMAELYKTHMELYVTHCSDWAEAGNSNWTLTPIGMNTTSTNLDYER